MSQKIIPGKHLGSFDLLPAKEGKCPECAWTHAATQPHNQQSLFYRFHFFNQTGRCPTWGDAMDHCSAETKADWKDLLIAAGVKESDFVVSSIMQRPEVYTDWLCTKCEATFSSKADAEQCGCCQEEGTN